jgi:hypothetical protein
MDLEKLREMIAAMRQEGLNNEQIARKLHRQGVKSLRGSKTPTATMVGYHVRVMEREAQGQPAKERPTPTIQRTKVEVNKLELAQKVLATDLPVKDKLDLVEGLLS